MELLLLTKNDSKCSIEQLNVGAHLSIVRMHMVIMKGFDTGPDTAGTGYPDGWMRMPSVLVLRHLYDCYNLFRKDQRNINVIMKENSYRHPLKE